MAPKCNRGGGLGPRISSRAMGIAPKTPRFARRPYAWWLKQPGPGIATGQWGPAIATPELAQTSAPRRRCPRATFPNPHRPSHPPHYRQQSRMDNRALNATADGDESSASVSASWLSPPLHPGKNFDDASDETGRGAYRAGWSDAPSMQSRGDRGSLARISDIRASSF